LDLFILWVGFRSCLSDLEPEHKSKDASRDEQGYLEVCQASFNDLPIIRPLCGASKSWATDEEAVGTSAKSMDNSLPINPRCARTHLTALKINNRTLTRTNSPTATSALGPLCSHPHHHCRRLTLSVHLISSLCPCMLGCLLPC